VQSIEREFGPELTAVAVRVPFRNRRRHKAFAGNCAAFVGTLVALREARRILGHKLGRERLR